MTKDERETPAATAPARTGHAAIAYAKLLSMARDIVANSTSEEAKGFDAAAWLERWIERRQPALGGRRSSEFLDTEVNLAIVLRLLGSIESGAYQ